MQTTGCLRVEGASVSEDNHLMICVYIYTCPSLDGVYGVILKNPNAFIAALKTPYSV